MIEGKIKEGTKEKVKVLLNGKDNNKVEFLIMIPTILIKVYINNLLM